MKFGSVESIHFFWFFPALLLFLFFSFRTRKKALEKFADKDLLNDIMPSLDSGGLKIKAFITAVSVFLLIITLMRPQYGFEWKEVKRSGLDILIAIDTSNSMLAEDVKPNRLERSKLAVKDLIKNLRGDRVGLIAFAGSAFLQCPLTVDYSGFMLSLDALDTGTIPRGGTSITSAIRTAIRSYEGGMKKYKVLIIITDGEDHEGAPMEAAEDAKKEGIKIFTIGIGTKQGELIPVTDRAGNRSYLKDGEGNVVKTRLDEMTMQGIALNTGGSYVKSTRTEFGLDFIYEEKLSDMERRETVNRMIKKYRERFQYPLLAALLLLCLEPFIRERKRVKR